MKIIDPNDVLIVERGEATPPITLKLSDTNAALSRLHEIRNTNAGTFPELASTFIQATSELFQAVATVRQELIKTEYKLTQLRARLLVEEVSGIIEAKHLKNTVDMCNAVLALNPEYSKLSYAKELLDGALLVLEGKLTTLRGAQFAIGQIAKLSWDNRNNNKLTLTPINTSRQPDPYDLGE